MDAGQTGMNIILDSIQLIDLAFNTGKPGITK